MPDNTILALVQIFLLLMLVVGAAAKEIAAGSEADSNPVLGFAVLLLAWMS